MKLANRRKSLMNPPTDHRKHRATLHMLGIHSAWSTVALISCVLVTNSLNSFVYIIFNFCKSVFHGISVLKSPFDFVYKISFSVPTNNKQPFDYSF
jgi:hypothetical protein